MNRAGIYWKYLLPLLTVLVSAIAIFAAMGPVIAVSPYLVPSARLTWYPARPDNLPRRPIEFETIRDLHNPNTLQLNGARQYTYAFTGKTLNATKRSVLIAPVPERTKLSINALRFQSYFSPALSGTVLGEVRPEGYQAGINRIEVIVSEGTPLHWPRGAIIGPSPEVNAAAQRLSYIEQFSLIATAITGAIAAMLGFLTAATAPDRREMAVPAAAAFTLALISGVQMGLLPDPLAAHKLWILAMLEAFAAWLLLVAAASRRDVWSRTYSLLFRFSVVALAFLLACLPLSLALPDEAPQAALIASAIAVAIAATGAATRFTVNTMTLSTLSAGERSVGTLAALALLALTLEHFEWLGFQTFIWSHVIGVMAAAIATTLWLAGVIVMAYRDIEKALQSRMDLTGLVRQQQAQIEAQRRQLEQEVEKRAISEERERFSRDIHDGVGSALVSLLMQARTGQLKEVNLQSELESALEDLRMMIDALDHSRQSIPAAFAALQTRVAPAFAAAGIELEWHQEGLENHTLTNPQNLLQIFRILQEACTNVIKHSKASEAKMTMAWSEEQHALTFKLSDNGTATALKSATGRGLTNMKRRAEKIGGQLNAGPMSAAGGWSVELSVPGQ